MTTLRLYRGLPACGKTTRALQWLAEDPSRRRVNRDDLRVALYGAVPAAGRLDQDGEKLVTHVQRETVTAHLRSGHDVVVDDTNLRDKVVRDFMALADRAGAEVEIIDLRHIDPLTCVNNDAHRGRNGGRLVGREVIQEMHKRLIAGRKLDTPLAPVYCDSDHDFEPVRQDPLLPSAYVFDVDGTLADNHHRNPHDEEKIHADAPIRGVVEVLQDLHSIRDGQGGWFPEPHIVIATARRADKIGYTVKWLENNNIEYDDIWCRGAAEEGVADPIVKYRILKEISKKYRIVGWFDDRNRVARMLRQAGIQVFQVSDPDKSEF